jgi:hypothetical protein
MKKYILAVLVCTTLLPGVSLAHEHGIFKIGDGYYQITIGSMHEPVVVDDKSGVEFWVYKCTNASCTPKMSADGDMDGPVGPAVTGLEKSVKVEIQAGNKKKMLDIKPKYGEFGSYYAPFYPTVATTYTYRIVGEINLQPVDLSFTCATEGSTASDEGEKKISDSVTQISKGGAFGCPKSKAELGFPESAPMLVDVASTANQARTVAWPALGIALAALALAISRRK